MLVLQVNGKAVSVPGRALAGIITHLKASLEPDSYDLLQSYHQLVVSHLRALSTDTSSAQELDEMQEQLAAKLQSVKHMAGVEGTS